MVFLTSLEGSRIYVIQLTRCFIYFSIFPITAKRLHWGHHWPNAQKETPIHNPTEIQFLLLPRFAEVSLGLLTQQISQYLNDRHAGSMYNKLCW